MRKDLLDQLIETSIAPIANWDLEGSQLNVRVVKPDTSSEEIESLQRGAKFVTNIESPNIIQNLEYFGIQIPSELRGSIIKYINGESERKEEEKATAEGAKLTDARGTVFSADIHAVDETGRPVLTKFKTFKKKD